MPCVSHEGLLNCDGDLRVLEGALDPPSATMCESTRLRLNGPAAPLDRDAAPGVRSGAVTSTTVELGSAPPLDTPRDVSTVLSSTPHCQILRTWPDTILVQLLAAMDVGIGQPYG